MDIKNAYTLMFIIIGLILSIVSIFFTFDLIFKKIIDSIKRRRTKAYFKSCVVKNKKRIYNDVSLKELEVLNTTNIDLLKDELYDLFYKFEMAYNSLDYNIMKMISTTELYNNYYTGISLDLKVGEKRVIEDIERKKVYLYEVISTSSKQAISMLIEVSYKNYRINKEGRIISGKRLKPITERFEVVFRKDFETKRVVKCPNCGAAIMGNKCEYCRTTIKDVEFKISSIKRILD